MGGSSHQEGLRRTHEGGGVGEVTESKMFSAYLPSEGRVPVPGEAEPGGDSGGGVGRARRCHSISEMEEWWRKAH